jgi:metacaspase-1
MSSNRRALCVGINVFKKYPSATLQGCVNDAMDMKGILKEFLKFTDADITVLTNEGATKANIMTNLKSMVADAKEGKLNYLVFSMSSHGTQVPDTSGDEPDRADEAFCPHDLDQKGNQWDPAHIIVDDELHDLFIQLPKNVLLEVYLDTCHSGSGIRAIDMLLDRRPRYLPPPSIEAFMEVEDRRSRGLHQAFLEKGLTHHILWAACRADQTSADAHIGGDWHGAFTYFFVKEMRAARNDITRSALLKKVRNDLKTDHYTQTPQLECEATSRKVGISP